jgi:hypothetical protein
MDKGNLPNHMNERMADLRSFDGEGSLAQLELLSKRAWTGVARVRTDGAFGAVWFVKGHCVHAIVKRGQTGIYGWKALKQLSRWGEGAILLEKNVLPPERSIRLEQRDIWTRLKAENAAHTETADGKDTRAASDRVKAIQADMVNHIPGVLYLSTTQGRKTAQFGSLDEQGQSWARKCLAAFPDKREIKRLVVENKKRLLLMSKTGNLQTVVVASTGTDVQELLNAITNMNAQVSAEPCRDDVMEGVR